MSARYSLEELRETLLADSYFMECIRDAAEKVPQLSPFPGMTGGWFDEFFDSEHEKEDDERHGYRWAMRAASTDDEVFEAVRLTFDQIGFNKDWSAGEIAVFEYRSQREFGYGCSCPGVRYSIHEIGGVYFVWYFRDTSVETWDTMDSDDRHDRRIGSFYITFEDALEDVCSWVDSDLEYEKSLCEERWREEKRMEGGCEDSGGDEDGCSWFDDECPEFDFSLSRSFAEHALGRGARIVPAELHPGHDVSRRFPPGHRLLRESHSDMKSAEGWRVGGQEKKPVIDLSFSRWDSPPPPEGLLPEDACCSYTLDELGGSLLASAHFMKKIHLAATNFAREIPDSRGCLQALEHPESGEEAFAAVSTVLNSINFGGVSANAEATVLARFTGSGCHSLGTDLMIITVHCIGMLFFAWCWYIVPIEGSGSSRQAAKGRVGDFFVTYDDALRAAFNLAEAWSGAERAELSKRTNLYDRQKEASGGAGIGKRPELSLDERWDLEEFESRPFLGRGASIVPAAIHQGHDISRRLNSGDPVFKHINFVSLQEEEERRERLKAYLERMRNRRAW